MVNFDIVQLKIIVVWSSLKIRIYVEHQLIFLLLVDFNQNHLIEYKAVVHE